MVEWSVVSHIVAVSEEDCFFSLSEFKAFKFNVITVELFCSQIFTYFPVHN